MMLLRVAFSLSCCCKFDDSCKFNEYCASAPVKGKGKFSVPCSRFRLSFLEDQTKISGEKRVLLILLIDSIILILRTSANC